MLLTIKGKTFNFIGDPHMGKKFSDVPLHRRGERERMQLDELRLQLNTPCDFNINVGDLFDTWDVDNAVLMDVYEAYKEAVANNPDTIFITISGNHDISRNGDTIHSFDVLKEMLRTFQPQVKIHTETFAYMTDEVKLLFCPYSAFKTSNEEVSPYITAALAEEYMFDLVVGHWDVGTIAGPDNLVPKDELFKVTDIIVTGHEHTAAEFKFGDKRLYKTGSMQPYSHGEDPNGEFYVTVTLEQLNASLAADVGCYHNKAVRLVLSPEENPPGDIDCLQFAVKRIDTSIAEIYKANLDEDFSFNKIFAETFAENGLDEVVTDKYFQLYKQEASNVEYT